MAETDYDDKLDKLVVKGSVESVATLLAKEDEALDDTMEVPDERFYRPFITGYKRDFVIISVLLLLNIFFNLLFRRREK